MRHLSLVHSVPAPTPTPAAKPPAPPVVFPPAVDPSRNGLCRRLKRARDLAGMTLEEAAAIHRGSLGWLANVEAGVHELTAHELECFAAVYCCGVEWLLGLVPERAPRSALVTHLRRARRPLSLDDEDRILTILAFRQKPPQKTISPDWHQG